MSNFPDSAVGHSAQVRLRLEYQGMVLPLLQVAPDWIVPAEPRDLPPAEAEVVTEVDGRPRRRPVFLTEGMSASPGRVQIRPHMPVS